MLINILSSIVVFTFFPGVTCRKFASIVSPALKIDFIYFHDVVLAMNSY